MQSAGTKEQSRRFSDIKGTLNIPTVIQNLDFNFIGHLIGLINIYLDEVVGIYNNLMCLPVTDFTEYCKHLFH